MRLTTTTTALAAILLAGACAQDGADVAAYEEAPADAAQVPADPAPAEAYETADAEPVQDEYAALEDSEPLPAPYEEAPLDADGMGAQPYDDPIAQELAGADPAALDPGMTEPLAGPLAEDDAIDQVRDDFAMADIDGDGVLSRDEYLTLAPMTAPAAPVGEGDAEPVGDAMGGELAGADPSVSEYLTAKFEAVAGNDEAVSLDEMETATREDFAAADEDGDAVLTGAEAERFAALREGRAAY